MVAKLVAETFREIPLADATLMRAEADHRIANNLALVAGLTRVQARSLPESGSMEIGQVRQLLQEVSLRIDAIGQLHHLLAGADAPDSVDLAEYVGRVAEIAIASFSQRASLSVELASLRVPSKQASAVGLIVEEAITNALKYSHPTGVRGKISVECRRNAAHAIVVEIADDGVGFPEGFDPATSSTLGMRLQRSLAQQIDAQLDYDASGIGLRVRLTLPAPFVRSLEAAE